VSDPMILDNEFISVPEWARRVGCSKDSAYKAAMRAEIPGAFKIGRLVRINWPAFVHSTELQIPSSNAPRTSAA
jgi:predicted DNA-binding transcriptional regulator AlpA